MTIECPRCGTFMPASFRFCSNCGQQLQESDSERIGMDSVRPQNGFPTVPPALVAERRQITVMFCDLVGSTELANRLDPEDLRDVVRRYQESAARAIERHEGYIAQYLGDGILAYFGYPVAHEGEAERAVRSSLAVLKEMKVLRRDLKQRHGVEIAVRIGLHTGVVVMGEIGAGARREHLALGETPNLAARLQAIAPENTVVISEATYRLVSTAFDCVDMGLRPIKGLARDERIYQVKEERLEASPLDLFAIRGPFSTFGREKELEAFRDGWRSTEEGHGCVLTISGEPGIGKSHVVQLFRQELAQKSHFRVECRCSQYLRSSALHPVVDWLYRVLNFYPEQPPSDRLAMIEFVAERNELTDPDTVPLLASLLSVPIEGRYLDPGYSPALKKDRTEQVLIDLLLKIRADRPLVLIMEDLHWADPSTKAFISRFAAHVKEGPILIVITSRPRREISWPQDVPLTTLHLTRLNREQAEALISEVAKDKLLPPDVVDQIVAKTDGVPLFVEELTKMVIGSGLVVECDDCFELTEGRPELAIPSTLQDSLMARLDRLLPVKEVALLCSVIGREFSFRLAEAVSLIPESSLGEALEKLVESDILLSDGVPPSSRYMFRHALLQEAAYESLLKSRRQEIHRRIAEFLVRNPDIEEARPEIIAHHFTRAGARDEAANQWYRAGQHASERWANEESIDYFTRALALLEGLPATPDRQRLRFFVQAGLGIASIQTKGYSHPMVLSAFQKAGELVESVDDPSLTVSVLRGTWFHYTVLGDHRKAESLAAQLIAMASRTNETMHMLEAEVACASTRFWRGYVLEAREMMEDILVRYEGAESLPPSNLSAQHPAASVRSYLGLALWYLGFPEEAVKRSREAVEAADRIGHPFSQSLALTFYAVLCSNLGDRDGTREAAQRAVEISSRFGFPFWLAISTVMRSWSMAEENPASAVTSMRLGLGTLQGAGAKIWTAYPTTLMAELLSTQNRYEEALHLADSVVSHAEITDEKYFLPEVLRIRANLLDVLGRQGEAETTRHEALALAEEQSARPIALRILADVRRRTEPARESPSSFVTASHQP